MTQRELPAAFLLGAPRSGTSLLYKVLCLHPEAAWISNWVRRYPKAPALAVLNRATPMAPGVRRQVWFGSDSNAYVYGSKRTLRDRSFPMPVEGEPIFERAMSSGGVPNGVASEEQSAALSSALASIRRFGGGRVVVSKRISNNRRIPFLLQAFPSARFIEIVRDGRAVAYSLSRVDWWPDSKVWWYGSTPRRWEADGNDPWELCARNWVEETRAIEQGKANMPVDQILRVRYEDLLQDPLECFAEIAGFCGLRSNAGWLSGLRKLSYPDRNDGWRRRLDEPAVATIERVQSATLARYGYALSSSKSLPEKEPPIPRDKSDRS